jgi:hypothetical protein
VWLRNGNSKPSSMLVWLGGGSGWSRSLPVVPSMFDEVKNQPQPDALLAWHTGMRMMVIFGYETAAWRQCVCVRCRGPVGMQAVELQAGGFDTSMPSLTDAHNSSRRVTAACSMQQRGAGQVWL